VLPGTHLAAAIFKCCIQHFRLSSLFGR
jgi:hypothetical protein